MNVINSQGLNEFNHHFDVIVLLRVRENASAAQPEVAHQHPGYQLVPKKVFANVLEVGQKMEFQNIYTKWIV